MALVAAVAVHHAGQPGAEALLVHPPLNGVDAVGEGVQAVGVVTAVPLEGHLHLVAVFLLGEEPDLIEQRVLGGVHLSNKVADAVLIAVHRPVGAAGAVGPQVSELDLQVAVQKRHHLEPLQQGLGPEPHVVEDALVGPEANGGAGPTIGAVTHHLEVVGDVAAIGKRHGVPLAAPVDLHLEPGGQGVHHRHAHAVQAAGYLVAVAPELAPGVQQGEHHRYRAHLRILGMGVDGDASAVVSHLAPAVGQQAHLDRRAVAGHGLVHRVVHHLVHQVVQSGHRGRPDVHARTRADSIETFENGDVFSSVRLRRGGHELAFLPW